MSARIGINGFGRIGRLAARALAGRDDMVLAHVNELHADAATCAHLLEFDTVHGRFDRPVAVDGGRLVVDGAAVGHSQVAHPSEIDWDGAGVDLVLECTGAMRSSAHLQGHLDRGAQRVVVSAPVADEGVLNVVMGCNEHLYDPTAHPVVTAASCTTNCLAPLVKVLHESLGIERAMVTTIHDVTNTQVIVDAPHRDLRRARSALNSLVPTSTGSATAITMIFPELTGRIDGVAVRVPLLNASLTDLVAVVNRDTTIEEVNDLFRAASTGPLAGILGAEERPLVSADYVNDTRSGIVDLPATMVTDGRMVKVLAWYDNEMGYAHRMVDLAALVVGSGW